MINLVGDGWTSEWRLRVLTRNGKLFGIPVGNWQYCWLWRRGLGTQVIFPSPFSIFPPTLCFHFYSYLFRGAFCDFLGSGQQFLFSDSCMTWRPGRSPEKWHVNNTVAPCQVQWNLSLRISQGPGHVFLWHAEMLSNALMSLVHRWAGILHPRC